MMFAANSAETTIPPPNNAIQVLRIHASQPFAVPRALTSGVPVGRLTREGLRTHPIASLAR
ncbi:hypothetical protein CCR94_09310 [Rhodoblastus sphagnicola]|uniref:Uncharacterized protein n=1 Tax=Rhodoblastus sphagnicola TaxID=333368 RepID=A0A2S6NA41_9HYPH|nr:hypothetical protein CCR94_09310 [Rhodoblastus sphagnicola]